MRIKKLSPRLKAIADKIGQYQDIQVVADIGTDHGYLPIHLIHNKMCSKVLASDIKEGPLNMARRNVEKKGITDEIQFILTDGLRGISAEVDCVIIAGMGGTLITKILLEGCEYFKHCKPTIKLIVQPMTHQTQVTEWLVKNGWSVVESKTVIEDRRIYIINTCIRNQRKRIIPIQNEKENIE